MSIIEGVIVDQYTYVSRTWLANNAKPLAKKSLLLMECEVVGVQCDE